MTLWIHWGKFIEIFADIITVQQSNKKYYEYLEDTGGEYFHKTYTNLTRLAVECLEETGN